MTLDEALSLPPGVDLDREVARRVMLWDVNYTAPDLRGGALHWYDRENRTAYLPGQFAPSQDIAAAWRVVERLTATAQRSDFTLSHDCGEPWPGGRAPHWLAFFPGAPTATGETAELAICRAALGACRGDDA